MIRNSIAIFSVSNYSSKMSFLSLSWTLILTKLVFEIFDDWIISTSLFIAWKAQLHYSPLGLLSRYFSRRSSCFNIRVYSRILPKQKRIIGKHQLYIALNLERLVRCSIGRPRLEETHAKIIKTFIERECYLWFNDFESCPFPSKLISF